MYKFLLLVYLLSADSFCKGDIWLPPPEEEIVYWESSYPPTGCTLPCRIDSNHNATQPPRVSWFLQASQGKYIALNDTAAWERGFQKESCTLTYAEYKNFTRPSYFDCIEVSSASEESAYHYECDQILDRCYYGKYLCEVEFEDGIVVEKNAYVRTHSIIEPPLPLCLHPTASNLFSQVIHDSITADEPSQISLTWTASPKRDPKTNCNRRYCPQSRKYEVKMFVYNSLPQGPPDYETPWLRTKKKRSTNHVFKYPDTTSGKYFQFQVKNTRPWGTIAYGDIGEVQIKTSGIFYLGEQEKARLTKPSHSEVITASDHETYIISCDGTGTPPPHLTLSYEEGEGKFTTFRESTGSAIEFFYIVNRPSLKFICTASNYIVNALGEVEHIVDSLSITVQLIAEEAIN